MEKKGEYPQEDSEDKLNKKLALIEDLWERLVYVKWSREPFALLAQLARDMGQTARNQGRLAVAELASQLEHQVNDCLATGQMPQGRLGGLLGELRRMLTRPEAAKATEPPPTAATDIMVIAADEQARQLILRLSEVGLRIHHLEDLDQAHTALRQVKAMAIIVDVDSPKGPGTGIAMIAQLRQQCGLAAPVFFMASHGDISTRLQAVRAGGVGYFTKPLDMATLLGKLNDPLLYGSPRGCRVLIVNDGPGQGQWMAGVLETEGIITQVVTQPLQVMLAINRFQPDLVLLDLDLQQVRGMELAQVIRQHPSYEDLPMLLFSAATDRDQRLAVLQVGGADLLDKPLNDDDLLAAVTYRLRRARILHSRLSVLSHKDAISGLYNRQYFLTQLQSMTSASRCVAVMLILMDNLRSVREATDVAAIDQLIEQAARRLQATIGPSHLAARFGDALFAVAIRDTDTEALLTIARAIRQSLEAEAYQVNGHTVQLNICIGISSAADGQLDCLTLIQHADLACSTALEAKGERIQLHGQADRQIQESQRRLAEEIGEAIGQQRMGLVFQPIVNLRGDPAERYEVFLRMHNHNGRELLPETVFAVAQRHRLGVALDRWVIAQAIRLLQERQALFFINLSVASLEDVTLQAWLGERLSQSAVPAKGLVFEVAQATAEQHPQKLRRFVDGINALGCGFALERFGCGVGSERLLKGLPAHYVKLDPHLVHGLVGNTVQQQQLKKRVDELKAQGVITIASGVEDLYTLPLLWACGIHYVQGYFLQRPQREMSYDFSGGVI